MLNFPHSEQYSSPIAIHGASLEALLNTVRTPELLEAHMEAFRAQSGAARPTKKKRKTEPGRIGLIDIVGPLSKFGSSLSPALPMVVLRRHIRDAAADPTLDAIVLRIDSPGGTIAGTDDLGLEIAAAAKRKPVTAFIEDLGASGAYWLASQAGRVVATPSSLIGSIGVFHVLRDFSEGDRQRGIRTIVVRSGSMKGVAVAGAPVTAEEEAEIQRIVDGVADLFLERVASGRKLSTKQARELADGRVHLAAEAKRLRLVDEIGSLHRVLAELERQTGSGPDSEPVASAPKRELTAEEARELWAMCVDRHGGDLEAAKLANVDLYGRYLETNRAGASPANN